MKFSQLRKINERGSKKENNKRTAALKDRVNSKVVL
jgi:hypothetical protein